MKLDNLTMEYFEMISKAGKQCKGINIYAVDKEGQTYLVKKIFLTEQEISIIKLAK